MQYLLIAVMCLMATSNLDIEPEVIAVVLSEKQNNSIGRFPRSFHIQNRKPYSSVFGISNLCICYGSNEGIIYNTRST